MATIYDDLISFWTFDTDADDKFGTNDAIVTGATLVSDGINGGAYDLNGSSDRIDVPDSDDLNFTDGNDLPFSFSGWIKPLTTGTTQVIASKWLSTGSNFEWACMLLNAGNVGLWLKHLTGTAEIFAFSTSTITMGVWTHVAITYDGSESNSGITTYINGVAQSMTTGGSGVYTGMGNGTAPVIFGVRNNSGSLGNWFKGKMANTGIFGEVLSQEKINLLFESGNGAVMFRDLRDNIVAYWDMDSDATDKFGGHDGSVTGATNTAGKINNGYSFNGTTDNILVSDATELSFTDGVGNDQPFSISVWVKPTFDTVGNPVIISKLNAANNDREWLMTAFDNLAPQGAIRIDFWNTSGGSLTIDTSSAILTTGVWTHVVMTYDGSGPGGTKIYADGSQVPTVADVDAGYTNMSNTAAPVYIGARKNGGAIQSPWQGLIDEPVIFDKVLSAQEVRHIYNSGDGRQLKRTLKTGLVSAWPFDNDADDKFGFIDGVPTGATNVAAKINNGYSFSGSGQYITFLQDINLAAISNNGITISYWAKYTTTGSFSAILGLAENNSGEQQYQITANAGGVTRLRLFISSNGSSSLNRSVAVPGINDGSWHHHVWYFKKNTSEALFWFDGTPTALSVNSNGTVPLEDFTDGIDVGSLHDVRSGDNHTLNFTGDIDELKFWSRELSDAEVLKLYNAANGVQIPMFKVGPIYPAKINGIPIKQIKKFNTAEW